MMLVVVVDANILIDLLNIESINEFFKLDFVFHTTDFIIGEISEHNLNKYIKNQKLRIITFDSKEIIDINQLGSRFRSLSIPDCSCIKACQKTKAILLTGEKKLRKIVGEEGIEAHGIIWIFKNLMARRIVQPDYVKMKLLELLNVNSWSPKDEIQKFIKKI